MTATVIIDAIVVIILVGFAVWGAKRGLFQSLAALLTVVIALVGAGIVAATFATPVTNLVSPLLEERITAHVQETIDAQKVPEVTEQELPVEELLNLLGIDHDVRSSIAERTEETVRTTGVTLVMAVAENLMRTFFYAILFLLSFVVLLILLKTLISAMNLILKLPGLHALNCLGGAVIGVAEGVLFLFLAIWIARRFGVSFETELLKDAHILRIFTNNTPLSLLSFLQ